MFKATSDKFREALCVLTGFRIDWNYKTSILRLRSMYAEQEAVRRRTESAREARGVTWRVRRVCRL